VSAQPANQRQAPLPELGRRGEGWVIAQVVLMLAILLSALVGLGWPDSLELAASVVGGVLLAAGGLLVVVGALQLGSSLTPLPAPRSGQPVRERGLYARVRHPMYGGGIVFALGWSTVFASVVGVALTVLAAVFLELKARREEQWLVERLPGYADYRRRVRRKFIPFLY
jgi:protein-S-isoprenylcysteine O-methyltransferase Ste14